MATAKLTTGGWSARGPMRAAQFTYSKSRVVLTAVAAVNGHPVVKPGWSLRW
ncbi:MAG: hypothetical protein WA188_02775 [Terriglobales bacterium]